MPKAEHPRRSVTYRGNRRNLYRSSGILAAWKGFVAVTDYEPFPMPGKYWPHTGNKQRAKAKQQARMNQHE